MMIYLFRIIFLLFITTILSACETLNHQGKNQPPPEFQKVLVQGGNFLITTYQKITDDKKPYVFYIEGDGAAFINRRMVSPNPTPRNKMLLGLVELDNRPNIIYVARPCQYTDMALNPKCISDYWTDKRMSEEVIYSLNAVINHINNNHKFSLIGFSGGGGVAALIAARNTKVKDILTISANLDHVAFTNHHRVPPMSRSLNPIDYANEIKHIPQLHISGGKDKIVPSFIADKFVQKSASLCVKHSVYKNSSHNEGWKEVWQSIYQQPINCD